MFLKRLQKAPEVAAGAIYSRSRPNNVVETAKVIAIRSDMAGIPHVRFNLHIEAGKNVTDEERTLSLTCFSESFKERVPA
ncbi:MAG TPA: hypothetical protein VFO41_03110 [Alphaproteobacteria bacterium]|nr:hypothetical protein [Alphaproteobacteria bacterium]